MILETAAIVSAAKPLVEPFVEKYVTSKLQSFAEWCKKKHKEVMIPTSEHFQEYLERMYDKYSIINTLVFHNSQRKLKDIYVDQTITKENHIEDGEEKTKIEGLPVKLIKKYQKILITDTAGMGKSTIMKRMFVDLMDKGLDVVGIPIYIELNKLSKSHTILTEIQEELNSLSEEFDKDLLLKLIQTGGFIFFLDGFDEISIKDRSEVTIDVHNFISKAGNKNYYILTSRPESGLASFGDFQSFTIQPLTKDEAFELLEKYDLSKKKELSRKLVELLKSGQYNTIDEYLVNPLLVSLLYTAYDYNQSIPFEKHRFYGVVFDAYFEKHDSSKPIKSRDKLSGLNHDGFDSVLRYVGYKCLTNIGVKFDEDTILNTIREARTFCGNLSFAESDLLKDLVSSVPLFCKEGTDYKWLHKSLLEYFAARFIYCDAKRNQDAILSTIYKSEHIEKYINMLDIYYDIDYKGFSKNITLPLCEDFIKYYNENIIDGVNVKQEMIDNRISYLYCHKETVFVLLSFKNRNVKAAIKTAYTIFQEQLGGEYNEGEVRFVPPTNDFICCLYVNDGNYFARLSMVRYLIHLKIPRLVKDWIIDSKLVIKNMEYGKAYIINVKTGEGNKQLYNEINAVLNYSSPYVLDYQSCMAEIDKINKELSQVENNSDLLSGI